MAIPARNSFEKWSLYFNGLLGNSGFNTVQGLSTTLGFNYFKRLNDKGKWWNSGVKANYSFSDKRLRPTFFFTKKWNNISRPQIGVSGGVTTAQFNGREPISGLDNTIRSLYLRDNYFKIFIFVIHIINTL